MSSRRRKRSREEESLSTGTHIISSIHVCQSRPRRPPSLPPFVLPSFPLPVSLLLRTFAAFVLSSYFSAFLFPSACPALPLRWCARHVFVYVHVQQRERTKEIGRLEKGEGAGKRSEGPNDCVFLWIYSPGHSCTQSPGFPCPLIREMSNSFPLLSQAPSRKR